MATLEHGEERLWGWVHMQEARRHHSHSVESLISGNCPQEGEWFEFCLRQLRISSAGPICLRRLDPLV